MIKPLSFFSFLKVLPPLSLQKAFGFWSVRLFFHAGTVLGMTILLSYFLAYYHAPKLPLLFLGLSIGTIVGTLITQLLSKKFSSTHILIGMSAILSSLLVGVFFIEDISIFWFFICMGGIFSVGTVQLNILFSMIMEHAFSPLESEEAFPLIESAEPLGGILGGALAFLGSSFLTPKDLLLLWAGCTAMGSMLLLSWKLKTNEVLHSPSLKKNNVSQQKGVIATGLTILSQNGLIRTLSLFVFLQSVAFLLIELLYSMSVSVLFHAESGGEKSMVLQELAHGIGSFHVSVYLILLLAQILFASRIQHSLGVVKTIFLQPIALLASGIAAITTGSFWIGIAGKGVFEIFGGISKNSYHSSFYSFKPENRETMKEFLEGVVRPFGLIISAFSLIIISSLAYLFQWNFIGFYIVCSGLLIAVLLLTLFIFPKIQKGYTDLARENIQGKELLEEKFDAVEILSQNGHIDTIPLLSQIIQDPEESIVIKRKIVEAFGRLQDENALPDILWCLEHENKEIQLSAVEALGKYKKLSTQIIQHAFSRHKIITALQNVFLYANSKKLRMAVIKVFQSLQYPEIASFLIESLHSKDRDTAFCAILGCASFNDISTAFYILPLTKSEDPFIKSASIIALWRFDRYRKDLTIRLEEMLTSADMDMQMSGVYTVGEVQYTEKVSYIKQTIASNTQDIHLVKHGLIALIKMGNDTYIPPLLSMIFHEDADLSSSTKKLLFSPGIESKLQGHIQSFVRKKVIREIHQILKPHKGKAFEILDEETLQKLLFFYTVIDEEKEIWEIKRILGEE